jgi:hypothetical protein
MTAAARQRLHAERKRNGLRVYPVLADEIMVTAVLLELELLTSQDPTPAEVADALSKWVYAEMTRQQTRLWPEL